MGLWYRCGTHLALSRYKPKCIRVMVRTLSSVKLPVRAGFRESGPARHLGDQGEPRLLGSIPFCGPT